MRRRRRGRIDDDGCAILFSLFPSSHLVFTGRRLSVPIWFDTRLSCCVAAPFRSWGLAPAVVSGPRVWATVLYVSMRDHKRGLAVSEFIVSRN